MSNRLQNWLKVSSGLFFVALILFVGFHEPTFEAIKKKPTDTPDFSFKKVTISQVDDGKILWELRADEASIRKSDQEVTLIQVNGDLFEDEKGIVFFSSPEAKLDMQNSNMLLNKAFAKFEMKDRWVNLNSDILYWNSNKRYLKGENNVHIRTHQLVLKGQSFYVDIPVNKISVTGKAFADVQL